MCLKITRFLIVFHRCTILLVLLGGLSFAAEPFSIADEQAIRSVTEEAVRMANSGSTWDAYTRFYYAENAVILPQDAAEVRGHDAIIEFFEELPSMNEMSFKVIKIEGRLDMAYDYGGYQLVMTPEDGEPINDFGKYIEIWKRQDNGTWKVAWDIFNSIPEKSISASE